MNIESISRPVSSDLIGGRFCLDFANTIHCYNCKDQGDDLASYSDLISWARRVGMITEEEERNLSLEAEKQSQKALTALKQAKALRGLIYRIFSAIAGGSSPSKDDLQVLNSLLPKSLSQARLAQTEKGFTWSWVSGDDALDQVLWPIVRSAADLLTSDKLGRIRECGGETCTWLFLDTSKNRSRTWCDMRACGNRAKSRRHYERVRSQDKSQQLRG